MPALKPLIWLFPCLLAVGAFALLMAGAYDEGMIDGAGPAKLSVAVFNFLYFPFSYLKAGTDASFLLLYFLNILGWALLLHVAARLIKRL